jgi:hypothetical protein
MVRANVDLVGQAVSGFCEGDFPYVICHLSFVICHLSLPQRLAPPGPNDKRQMKAGKRKINCHYAACDKGSH